MTTLDVKQGSTEWTLARLGVVTASEFDALITPEGKPRTGEGVKTYLYKKLTERVLGLTGTIPQTYTMENGSLLEREALPFLEFTYGWNLSRVGFCLADNKKCGASPDALIGEDGGLEAKCPQVETHMRYLCEGVVPKDYRAQVNFSLWITGRKWWKFVSYNRYLPPLVVHVDRDEKMMTTIGEIEAEFIANLDAAEAKVREMIRKQNEPAQP